MNYKIMKNSIIFNSTTTTLLSFPAITTNLVTSYWSVHDPARDTLCADGCSIYCSP